MNTGLVIFRKMQRLQQGSNDVRYTPVTPTKEYPYSTDYEFIHRKVPELKPNALTPGEVAHLTPEEEVQEEQDWQTNIKEILAYTPNLDPDERQQVLTLNPADWDDSTREKVGQASEQAGKDLQLQRGTEDVNPSFDTPLGELEPMYRAWKKQQAPSDRGEDYDYRGAFLEELLGRGTRDSVTGHWTDKFKKPNYPTFSVDSQYAGAYPERVGHWVDDTYVPAGYDKGTDDVGPRGGLRRRLTEKELLNEEPWLRDIIRSIPWRDLRPGPQFNPRDVPIIPGSPAGQLMYDPELGGNYDELLLAQHGTSHVIPWHEQFDELMEKLFFREKREPYPKDRNKFNPRDVPLMDTDTGRAFNPMSLGNMNWAQKGTSNVTNNPGLLFYRKKLRKPKP